jgi:hypothetical protein
MRRNLTVLIAASIAFVAVLSPALAGVVKKPPAQPQSRSDLGQQLQLQEANNIYARSTKAQSDMSAKYNATNDAIVQNMK